MNITLPTGERRVWIKVAGDALNAAEVLRVAAVEVTASSVGQVQVSEKDGARARNVLKRKRLYAGGPFSFSASELPAVTVAEARERFAELLNEAAFHGERVLITRHGKPVAAIVPAMDAELAQETEDRIDAKAAREAARDAKRGRLVPLEKVLRDLQNRR